MHQIPGLGIAMIGSNFQIDQGTIQMIQNNFKITQCFLGQLRYLCLLLLMIDR
ncbi:hypothetical protein MED297_05154 [Reinekea sp. MED297]|uniref:Uncharacterized protein n=1 Tax=Reinekea blandensis MED297 TaxID=314283 RepID=A4BJ52_9GAMM|nr:hypothetical protein MED297_05154 [Reinekea sp. MED297] [Reinekea blandensis MED297]